jgi:lysophospholipase L1-like esterase
MFPKNVYSAALWCMLPIVTLNAEMKTVKVFDRDVAVREVNYDKSKIPPYTLEDPLTFIDGRKVTPENWQERRKEILGIFAKEMFGEEPPKPDTVKIELVDEKLTTAGYAIRRQYKMWFKEDKSGPCINWIVWLPRFAKDRVGVISFLNYRGNHELVTDEDIPLPKTWSRKGDKTEGNKSSEKTRGIQQNPNNASVFPLGTILARGYAVMSACYCEVSPDPTVQEKDPKYSQSTFSYTGVFDLWGKRDESRTDNITAIGAWAWALSRGLDLAERIPEIDAKKSIVTGCSRLGKAALVAAARDERFAVCVPNQTGGGGVPLAKRDYGENVSIENRSFTHWYCKAYVKYSADPAKLLTFDQHLLLACIAPRSLLVQGFDSPWFDTEGEYLSVKAASPVWKMLGKDAMPDVAWPDDYDTSAIGKNLGYVRRSEDHGISAYDWMWLLNFADGALPKCSDDDKSLLPDGGTIAIAGDSITYHSVALPFGYYHQLTNAFAKVCPNKKINVAPLGFSGYQVGTWINVEKKTRDGKPYLTHVKNPVWDVTEVLSNKVDVVAIFLGMNDILQPSVRDNDTSLDKWATDLRVLIKALRERTQAKKFILCTTTPLTGDHESPKNLVRNRMAQRLRQIASEDGHIVAEFGDAVMKAIDDCRKISSSYQPVPDFVHPQELGHLAMASELCRALGEKKSADFISKKYDACLARVKAKSTNPISWRLNPITRIMKTDSNECAYRINWYWHDTDKYKAFEPGVKMDAIVPKGWKVVDKAAKGLSGFFIVSGCPEKSVNEIKLVATFRRINVSDVVPIATPWIVSKSWDYQGVWHGQNWKTNAPSDKLEKEVLMDKYFLVTPTHDYTGYIAAGSLDPWQVFFGGALDSFWAIRRVKSSKERKVKAIFSHQTFSATLGLTVFVNGEKVYVDTMNRSGKNKIETTLNLKAGLNEIRIRVDHANWQRQFRMELEGLEGDTLEDLRYTLLDNSK